MDNPNALPKLLEEQLFERPIPGQSLTNSPSDRYAWEGPPEVTSLKDAREAIFFSLTEPERLEEVQKLLMNGIPINAIAETLLVQGFRDGKFNPDMIVNLMEPTMVILLAIAEKSGIRPVVDSEDGSFEEDEEDYIMPPPNPLTENSETRRFLERKKRLTPPTLSKTSVGKNIGEELDKLNVKKVEQSLLQKPKPTGDMKSLLSKGE